MNKGITCIVLFALLIGIVCFEQIYVNTTIASFLDRIETVNAAMLEEEENVDGEKIKLKFFEMKDYWKEKENYLTLFIDHKDIREIGQSISRLEGGIMENDRVQVHAEIRLLSDYTKTYQKLVSFRWENIL